MVAVGIYKKKRHRGLAPENTGSPASQSNVKENSHTSVTAAADADLSVK